MYKWGVTLEFITLGEPGISLPERDKNEEYGMPSIHEYTTSSIDASVWNEKIFILHSGKSTKYREAFWYLVRGRIQELAENLETSNQLLIYDVENGDFIKRLTLPFEAKKVKVFNNKVYALYATEESLVLSVIPLDSL